MAGADGRKSSLSLVSPDADAVFYISHVPPEAPSALVLGSAQGHLLWALAEKGIRVHGVEPSTNMVATAEASRGEQRPELAERVHITCADLRSIRLGETFGAVFAPHNALGLVGSLDDLDAVLTTVREHLRPGGTFAFDVMNPPTPSSALSDDDAGHGPPRSVEPKRTLFTPHLRERVREGGLKGAIRRLSYRPFLVEELNQALRSAGFTPLERFGNFVGKPFDATDSVQLVVAQRDEEPLPS